jgi:hypothetical protein
LLLLAIFNKIRQVRDALASGHLQFRAVAQLGRAPGSGQYSDCFLNLSQLAPTCSTLGKSRKTHHLTCAQITPKKFHRWIKRWIKNLGGASATLGAHSNLFSNMRLPVVIDPAAGLIFDGLPAPASQNRARIAFGHRKADDPVGYVIDESCTHCEMYALWPHAFVRPFRAMPSLRGHPENF